MRLTQWIRTRPRGQKLIAAILLLAAVGPVGVAADAVLRARLPDGTHAAATRIYARPIVLTPGARIDRDAVRAALDRLGYRPSRSRTVEPGTYRFDGSRWTIGRRAFRDIPQMIASQVATVRVNGGRVAWIEDQRGRDLPELMLEPELLGVSERGTRFDITPVPLGDMPDHVVRAVLAVEDRRFYAHHGVDLWRVAGALVADIRARRIVQGGSTISQQLARTLFLSNDRTPGRKLRELAMALALEARYTKQELLQAYLDHIYLGQDGALAIRGVGRAARFYFGKDAERLSVAEAALLAGLIRGPSLYAPFRNPEAARERRDLVISVMLEEGAITEAEARRAKRSPLGLRRRAEPRRGARYFLDYVESELPGRERDGGHTVLTTLDPGYQRAAEEAVEDGLARLERDYPRLTRHGAPVQAALVALDPGTGEILAMVGGRDYGMSQFNRAVYARRQPGSAFKPVVALAALSGRDVTLASEIPDEPLEVETPQGPWRPVNYDGQFRGDVTLREALERSLNVPFARLGVEIGPRRIVETARKLGIEGPLAAVPSLALGASEVTPLEMARAFGVLAAYGARTDPHGTLAVLDRAGRVVRSGEAGRTTAFDPAVSYLVTSALEGAVERGTGRGVRGWGFDGAVAAKSGTTSDFRDAWFIGYTPSLAIAVWVGFDDGRSLGLTGSRAALPIFAQFLTESVGRDPDGAFGVPEGIEMVRVNRNSGIFSIFGCWGDTELFLTGTAPQDACEPGWREIVELERAERRLRREASRSLARLQELLRSQR
jgi:penicillin-binding protein 1B